MNILKNFLNDLQKKDTILAFLISTLIYNCEHKNIKKSIIFSTKFVLVFLIFLNLLF
jgi:hypothetical protein